MKPNCKGAPTKRPTQFTCSTLSMPCLLHTLLISGTRPCRVTHALAPQAPPQGCEHACNKAPRGSHCTFTSFTLHGLRSHHHGAFRFAGRSAYTSSSVTLRRDAFTRSHMCGPGWKSGRLQPGVPHTLPTASTELEPAGRFRGFVLPSELRVSPRTMWHSHGPKCHSDSEQPGVPHVRCGGAGAELLSTGAPAVSGFHGVRLPAV